MIEVIENNPSERPSTPGSTRRDLLRSMAALAGVQVFSARSRADLPQVSAGRVALLDEIERRACLFFHEQASSSSGLVLDRARHEGREDRRVASIAATGFGLSALAIADLRGYLPSAVARDRVERILEFFARRAPQEHGFFYHFLDADTGEAALCAEVSSVDTGWLLCGVIHARQHFDSPRIHRLAGELLQRVDWNWMLAGGSTLCHGWRSEQGFLPYRWDQYSELMAMYLLAMGSSGSAIPNSSWQAWKRPVTEIRPGEPFVQSPAPLFAHQYSHAWLDFRSLRDREIDYFENSRLATQLHRQLCLGMRGRFPWFADDMWGITSSDSRCGYLDWGGPDAARDPRVDGTLVPCAAGGSLVFLPEECGQVLEMMLSRYSPRIWTRYGFVDAFHPVENWWAPDIIGINLGIVLLMIENLRSQAVWKAMMSAPEVRRGFELAGMRPA